MTVEHDNELLRAVEQCCRENDYSMDCIRKYASAAMTDAKLVSYGASGPRIAFVLGRSDASVRRHLTRLARGGKVFRPIEDARGSAVRWWPAGLLAKLRSEWIS